ncbi:MAG: SulP family sulfate permease [Marinoscillum sp.]
MLRRLFPILDWLPVYQSTWLKGDISAGLTVGIMLIPQGLAYAMIAGLPPVYGLYAAIFPQLIYSIFGTSRQISVGPVAMDSLLVASGISVMASQGTDAYLTLVLLLTAFMGMLQLSLGIIKLGFITNLLSRPVISGFTSAAAIIIGLSQMKHILGIQINQSNSIIKLGRALFGQLSSTHLLTLGMGIGAIVLILALKKYRKNFPGALVAVAVGTGFTFLFGLQKMGVNIVAEIPSGLPQIGFPNLTWALFVEMLPLAMTLAVISFMESYSVSKSLESKSRSYKVLPNKELIALGLSNIVGSLFQAFPVAGGFSRSAVNYQSGANTPLAGIISAIIVLVTLLFLTPLFYYLPHAVLGAIILVAISSLIDWEYILRLWKDSKLEFILLIATLIITLLFSMVAGIVTGIILSILLLLYHQAYPHIAELGRLKGHHEFRNVKRFKNLEIWDDILILRLDASLTFINIQYFKEYIETEVKLRPRGTLKSLIIDAGPVGYLDASGCAGLTDIMEYLDGKKIELLICDVIGPVRDIMSRTGLHEIIHKEHVFLDLNEAVKYATTHQTGDYQEYALQSNNEV